MTANAQMTAKDVTFTTVYININILVCILGVRALACVHARHACVRARARVYVCACVHVCCYLSKIEPNFLTDPIF